LQAFRRQVVTGKMSHGFETDIRSYFTRIDHQSQRILAGGVSPAAIPAAFLVRFGLSTVSYAAGTPGGLFAPMLVLGAQFGSLYAGACRFMLQFAL
jgi:H+/Cl- antiporter ClcA